MNTLIIIISSTTFIFYGGLCLLTNHMRAEFKRYGFEKFRTLTAWLELLGGLGLMLGLKFPALLIFSSAGLSLLMFLGTLTRLRIKDPIAQIIPAASLMIINAFILWQGLENKMNFYVLSLVQLLLYPVHLTKIFFGSIHG